MRPSGMAMVEISNTGSEVRPVLRAVDVGSQTLRKFDQQAVRDPSCVVQQLKLFQQVAAKKNRHFLIPFLVVYFQKT
jgi:hypothetical protein